MLSCDNEIITPMWNRSCDMWHLWNTVECSNILFKVLGNGFNHAALIHLNGVTMKVKHLIIWEIFVILRLTPEMQPYIFWLIKMYRPMMVKWYLIISIFFSDISNHEKKDTNYADEINCTLDDNTMEILYLNCKFN